MPRPRNRIPGSWKKRTPTDTETVRLKKVVRTLKQAQANRKARPKKVLGRKAVVGVDGEYVIDARGRLVWRLKKGTTIRGGPRGKDTGLPRGIKASVRAIFEKVAGTHGLDIEHAVVDGVRSGPKHADRYLRVLAEYVDGKPSDNVNLNARWNQDELGSARERLGQKLSAVLVAVLDKTEKA